MEQAPVSEAPVIAVPGGPRRKRSVNVSTLPQEVSDQLSAEFSKYDKDGTGCISRDDVIPLIMSNSSSIYAPTDDEVTNTIGYLTRGDSITLEDFVMGYHRVAIAMGGVVGGVTEFKELTKTFNMELQCIAKAGRGHNLLPEGEYVNPNALETAANELGADCMAQVQERFQELAKENGSTLTRSDVADMLKTCYFPGKEKIDLVMNFFDADAQGEVQLFNFLNGMTLLYGDLSLLADAARRDLQLAADSVTPLSSPTTMFDGSPPER
jgi:Ca2+-binding EF-hand superfamily protein